MQTTIFDTNLPRRALAWLSSRLLKLAGWRVEGQFPSIKRCVMIAAPHSTNWDFPLALAATFIRGGRIYWMGKHTLFWGPMGPVMRFLGGIPVNRGRAGSLVGQIVDAYGRADQLVVVVPPEGTRAKVREWKTGFYRIACGAQVPIVLAYIDFPSRTVGFGPVFEPCGDIDVDMPKIRDFYSGYRGKYD